MIIPFRRDRSRERAEFKGVRVRPDRKDRAERRERESVWRAYADEPGPVSITLPPIRAFGVADDRDVRAPIRLAPKTEPGSPGVDRWREIHRCMPRDGKLFEPDLTEQFHK